MQEHVSYQLGEGCSEKTFELEVIDITGFVVLLISRCRTGRHPPAWKHSLSLANLLSVGGLGMSGKKWLLLMYGT